jgi:predicted  nucleic acid-binding Zn-ribbon protein
MAKVNKAASNKDLKIEDKLKALYTLQLVDTKIDKIKILRGELPLEVQDLEDELIGLQTRIQKFSEEVAQLQHQITDKKNFIVQSEGLIKKYKTQINQVKNNREFDSLNKEIEFQGLEIQLAEKRIREYSAQIASKNELIDAATSKLEERKKDLEHKKSELEEIVKETQKEELELLNESQKAAEKIEDRLLNAYKRMRKATKNGLAVVPIEREACGGCFNKIPPQVRMDIKLNKKITVCEHCGRILVDAHILEDHFAQQD